MIVGVGCDVVDIGRIEKNQEGLAQKVLSSSELAMYQTFKEKRKRTFLAGHFAAKEALVKAMDIPCLLSDFSIAYSATGKPIVEKAGYQIHLSISHDGNVAIAYAVVEK